jgi:predicted nucleotidyltransferase
MTGACRMAEIPDKIKKTIRSYLSTLQQNNIPIKEAVLFGSYATGKNHEWSDIDIALVSDLFVGNRMDDKDKIRDITLSVSYDIEVLPFAPFDFNSKNPFVKEILKTGIKLI